MCQTLCIIDENYLLNGMSCKNVYFMFITMLPYSYCPIL